MQLKRQEGHDDRALPNLHHWLIAVVVLSSITLVVPVIAGLT